MAADLAGPITQEACIVEKGSARVERIAQKNDRDQIFAIEKT
jgi:hypothetical protein